MSLVNMVDITYTITRNQDNHFLFISDECMASINLPQEIKDEFSSFGAEANKNWPCNTIQLAIVARLRTLLKEFWDLKYGVARFRFVGDIEKIGDELRHRATLIFVPFDNIPLEQLVDAYSDAALQCSRFVFFGTSLVTTDHNTVQSYLNQQRYEQRILRAKRRHSDFNVRMCGWYPEAELRETLISEAQTAIETFVTKKSLDIFIPNFLVVPVYHIRRYQKALQLISEVHMPNFTMSLPLEVNGKGYTILFPITYKNSGK